MRSHGRPAARMPARQASPQLATAGSLSGVEGAAVPVQDLDEESSAWLRRLGAAGAERRAAERELHARLVRIALAALILTFVATVYPAYQASRTQPAEALRYE